MTPLKERDKCVLEFVALADDSCAGTNEIRGHGPPSCVLTEDQERVPEDSVRLLACSHLVEVLTEP